MIPQQAVTKAKEQAHQFAQVLSMAYGLDVNIAVRIYPNDTDTKVKKLLQIVADYFETTVEYITTKGRKRDKIEPRMIAITLIYRTFKLEPSLNKTALWFGGQNHSTIINAMQTVEDLCSVDKRFALDFKNITELVASKIGTP